MSITIKDLVSELVSRGYKTTETGIKYYIDYGLLPNTEKRGTYKGGVALVFPDQEEVIEKALKIFELKGRNFKLSEIRSFLEKDDLKKKTAQHIKSLDNFVKINGRYYKKIDDLTEELQCCQNLWEAILISSETYPTEYKPITITFEKWDVLEIEARNIYQPTDIYQNEIAYNLFLCTDLVDPWIKLHLEFDLDWDILSSIFLKHADNVEKYFWPSPDGKRFSENSVGHDKRYFLNDFGKSLYKHIEFIRSGEFFYLYGGHYYSLIWDDRYESIDEFIRCFIGGSCVFALNPFGDVENPLFLKKVTK